MRRRRSSNALLGRMILIGVLVTIAVLPILAYLGAFKGGKPGSLMQMTMMPPPPKVPKQERQAKKPRHQKPHVASRKTGAKSPQSTKALNVHVQAAAGKGPPSDNSIVNGESTKVGVIPTPAPQSAPPATPAPATTPPPPVIAPPSPVAVKPKPAAPPPPVVEAPKPPPPPHLPVIVAAVALAQPQPVVPDDMDVANADSTFGALLTIRADGSVDAKMEQSTGNGALDQIAMDAARKWRFRPATKDGVPAQSYVHVKFEFQVG